MRPKYSSRHSRGRLQGAGSGEPRRRRRRAARRTSGERVEKRRDPKKTGSQRGAEEAERDPGGEEERGWILCLKRFQLETDRFLDKARFYHIRTDLGFY